MYPYCCCSSCLDERRRIGRSGVRDSGKLVDFLVEPGNDKFHKTLWAGSDMRTRRTIEDVEGVTEVYSLTQGQYRVHVDHRYDPDTVMGNVLFALKGV
jgi:hypothetical protein